MSGPIDDPATGDGHAADALSVDQVAEFLRLNPDFIANHPDLLDGLALPPRWRGKRVVDMHQFLLERLRGEIDNLRDCALDLIDTSRSNLANQVRTHSAVLAMIGADSLAELVVVVERQLPATIEVDVAMLGFEIDPTTPVALWDAGARRLPAGYVADRIGDERELILERDTRNDGLLFGPRAGIRSEALIRLPAEGSLPPGLFALGTRASGVFHPGQGTELLVFLARVLQRCVQRCLGRTR